MNTLWLPKREFQLLIPGRMWTLGYSCLDCRPLKHHLHKGLNLTFEKHCRICNTKYQFFKKYLFNLAGKHCLSCIFCVFLNSLVENKYLHRFRTSVILQNTTAVIQQFHNVYYKINTHSYFTLYPFICISN